MLFALMYGALCHLNNWQYQSLPVSKNKSVRKILNSNGPRIESCGTSKIVSCQLLSDEFILTRCFLFDR